VAHYHYLLVLAFIAVCALGVSLGFRLRVPRFWQAFILTDAVIMALYLAWDFWAVAHKNWSFDSSQILGAKLLHRIPIEEIAFFIIVPLMTIITYLALTKLLSKTKFVSDHDLF